jgi:hypothetical protein
MPDLVRPGFQAVIRHRPPRRERPQGALSQGAAANSPNILLPANRTRSRPRRRWSRHVTAANCGAGSIKTRKSWIGPACAQRARGGKRRQPHSVETPVGDLALHAYHLTFIPGAHPHAGSGSTSIASILPNSSHTVQARPERGAASTLNRGSAPDRLSDISFIGPMFATPDRLCNPQGGNVTTEGKMSIQPTRDATTAIIDSRRHPLML